MFSRIKAFVAVSVVAAVVEGAVVYSQLPSSQRRYCASETLGTLLATANQAEAELKAARVRLQKGLETMPKEILQLEARASAAWNEVAREKQRMSAPQPGAEKPCA